MGNQRTSWSSSTVILLRNDICICKFHQNSSDKSFTSMKKMLLLIAWIFEIVITRGSTDTVEQKQSKVFLFNKNKLKFLKQSYWVNIFIMLKWSSKTSISQTLSIYNTQMVFFLKVYPIRRETPWVIGEWAVSNLPLILMKILVKLLSLYIYIW